MRLAIGRVNENFCKETETGPVYDYATNINGICYLIKNGDEHLRNDDIGEWMLFSYDISNPFCEIIPLNYLETTFNSTLLDVMKGYIKNGW
jgi:hypothetical protein